MPIVPMKQTVVVKRVQFEADNRTNRLDEWGVPIYEGTYFIAPNQTLNADKTYSVKCRIEEGSSLTRYMSAGTSTSETIVATARILFDKLADVQYSDLLSYTNELGEIIERRPKEINVKRGANGKPIMTEVLI